MKTSVGGGGIERLWLVVVGKVWGVVERGVGWADGH